MPKGVRVKNASEHRIGDDHNTNSETKREKKRFRSANENEKISIFWPRTRTVRYKYIGISNFNLDLVNVT